MELFYEGKEIFLNINNCKITDNIDFKSDSLELIISDNIEECKTWPFEKGHKIKIINNNFDTGEMYVDRISTTNALFKVEALSSNKNIKTKKNRTWENVSFIDLLKDISKSLGLEISFYGVNNYKYTRVDQINISDIELIKKRCILEGCYIKIHNNKIIVISEDFIKNESNVIDISVNDIKGSYQFETTSNNIISGVKISSIQNKLMYGEYIEDNNGEIKEIKDIFLSSNYEANRFCKNIFNYINRNETTGRFYITLNTELAAGSVINLTGLSSFDGEYIVNRLIHDFINNKTLLEVRMI